MKIKDGRITILVGIVLLICLLFGCSSPEQRRAKAEFLGEVIYQVYPESDDVGDFFIVKKFNNDYVMVRSGQSGEIWDVKKIDMKCKQ